MKFSIDKKPDDIVMVKVASSKKVTSIQARLDDSNRIDLGLPVTIRFADESIIRIKRYTGDPDLVIVISDDQAVSIEWVPIESVEKLHCPLK
ncbi:MAG: hypothetical protein WCO30_00495 [bacterium]